MSGGAIAWILISSALVLFMTPGLALFYGGMVRAKNVLNMLMMNLFTINRDRHMGFDWLDDRFRRRRRWPATPLMSVPYRC